jgi:hypothetical protein
MKHLSPLSTLAMCLVALSSVGASYAADAPEPTMAQTMPDASQTTPRPPRPPEDAEQLERRLSSVEKLIEKSSAARQVEAASNPQAQEMRAQARELRLQAQAAFTEGKLPEASRLLDLAAKKMFESARSAAPEQLAGDKKKRDFASRLESVKALITAQKRISVEKKLGAKGAAAIAKLEAQTADAIALSNAGKLDQGRALLDQVYFTTKVVIEGLRNGDTLVRSLEFATKEDEYLYEVDRNDTHQMLVKVLLEEKRSTSPNLDNMVKSNMERAATLRDEAEALAAKKEFEAAIKRLESSTRELVRAIRGAGVYIPT